MIRLHDVTKTYPLPPNRRRVVMDRITFDIPRINLGILGANGAGKSTLLNLIAGIIKPDEGHIERQASVSWPMGLGNCFHKQLTGRENIRFIARMYGRDTESVVQFIEEFADLGDYLDVPVKNYSSGMSARLVYGASISMQFDYYLVDELVAVGDQRFREKSKRAFKEKLASSNLIMVSQWNEILEEYCDVGAVLHNGRLTVCDSLKDAIKLYDRNQSA